MREKYGYEWPDEADDLTIELGIFRLGLTDPTAGLGPVQHFRNIVDALWNREDSPEKFEWHPWAVEMLEAACDYPYLAVAGCAWSGKTHFFSVWAIVCFLSDPRNTTVLATSTSLNESKRRIWGRIAKYWQALPQVGLPGKLVMSEGRISFVDPMTKEESADSGIFLVAGDPKKEKDSVAKLIGIKNRLIMVVADELAELGHGILSAVEGNMDAVGMNVRMIGISNPKGYFDPFGIFAKPRDGWEAINEDSLGWETERGYCIRFDGERSPNIVAGETLYAYLPEASKINEKKRQLGENSPQFWRMYRGFWCPSGNEAGIYTEQEILQYGGADRAVDWSGETIRVGALDTAFTSGGDRACVHFGTLGTDADGNKVLVLDEGFETLKVDARKKDEQENFQIARQFKDLCIAKGVKIQHAGVDSTGAGNPFCDILATVWGTGFYRCNFSGSATERIASAADNREGNEVYYDRVSEIWYAGKELLRTGQFKGLYHEVIEELTKRLYDTVKRGDGLAIAVESKKKMRNRTGGKSPDIADAALILVDLCRERLGLDSVEGDSLVHGEDGFSNWDKMLAMSDEPYRSDDETTILNRFFDNSGFIPLT